MIEALQALDSRDIATACWAVAALVACCFSSTVRRSLAGVLKAAAAPQLVAVFFITATIYLVATYGLLELGLWTASQAKITVLWIVFGFFSFASDALRVRDDPTNLSTKFRSIFKLTIVAEFFINLYRFPLAVELVFVPLILLLGMLVATSERDPSLQPAKRVFVSLVTIAGLLVVTFSIYQAYLAGWSQFTPNLGRDFAVPILYAALSIPLLWLLALFSAYQEVFIRVPFVVKDRKLHRFTKANLLLRMRFDLRAIGRWLKIAWQVMPASKTEILQSIQDAKASAHAA